MIVWPIYGISLLSWIIGHNIGQYWTKQTILIHLRKSQIMSDSLTPYKHLIMIQKSQNSACPNFGSFWTILDHFGPFWTILDHLGSPVIMLDQLPTHSKSIIAKKHVFMQQKLTAVLGGEVLQWGSSQWGGTQGARDTNFCLYITT